MLLGTEKFYVREDRKVIAGKTATKRIIIVLSMILAPMVVVVLSSSAKADGPTLHTKKKVALLISRNS